MKAKYIGKVELTSNGQTFVPGEVSEVPERVLKVLGKLFEIVKVEEAVAPKAKRPTRQKPTEEK